ncbi:GNAT family N-acetyltransferase [Streptomyces sp. NBC_01497]|uniref:GNAT family N-acetyltransferase n=1 Tax=Streptomyces sp. NBC_01497 TaxID=2903885 RepID=UPI002E2F4E2E|nr:GNAT family N-acetyltransferase [Streptomyces sp. NBC_01497]
MTFPSGTLCKQLANFRDFWLGYNADPETGESEGLVLYRSGIPSAMYNGVLRVTPGVDLGIAFTAAARRLAGGPSVWWVGPDSDERTARYLGARGLTRAATMTVMEIDLADVTDVRVPEGITISRVEAPGGTEAWVRAYAPRLGVAPDAVDALVSRHEERNDVPGAFTRFEARDGEEIVGTSSMLDLHGVAGVYAVTTAESHLTRGVGTALTSAALHLGRERGRTLGTLQTATAASLYRRMGFRTVSDYQVFTRQ